MTRTLTHSGLTVLGCTVLVLAVAYSVDLNRPPQVLPPDSDMVLAPGRNTRFRALPVGGHAHLRSSETVRQTGHKTPA